MNESAYCYVRLCECVCMCDVRESRQEILTEDIVCAKQEYPQLASTVKVPLSERRFIHSFIHSHRGIATSACPYVASSGLSQSAVIRSFICHVPKTWFLIGFDSVEATIWHKLVPHHLTGCSLDWSPHFRPSWWQRTEFTIDWTP
jgi:hypothetical protein